MTEIYSTAPVTFRSITAPGIAGVRRYWKPFLLLQTLALLLVIGYYTSGGVRAACERLSALKQAAGWIFAAVAAGISGAILPEIAKAIALGERSITRKHVNDVVFNLIGFAIGGIIIDFQYRAMGRILGNGVGPGTVLKKMAFDQLITTPIYGIPYWVFLYDLRARRYNLAATVRGLSPRWYLARVMPLLIPAWVFWTPMVLLIYSLPGPLQFCLYCLALAAWSLVMVFVASRKPVDQAIDLALETAVK